MDHSREKSPEASEWKVPQGYYFNYDPRSGRKLLTIPAQIIQTVGGRDVIAREIFPEIFIGWPAWAEDFGDQGYCVELPWDVDSQTFSSFIAKIEEIANMKLETERLKSALPEGNQLEAVERSIGSRVKPLLQSFWSRVKGS